jgi:ribonucleoside-diphosphate reductase alpha chain
MDQELNREDAPMLMVTKRSGEHVEFNLDKIRKVVESACEGLGEGVGAHVLESQIRLRFTDRMETKTIQRSLIDAAIKLTTKDQLAWRFVAARLTLMDIKKEVAIHRPTTNYKATCEYLVAKGLYDPTILNTGWDLASFNDLLNQDKDRHFDYAGMNMLLQRYLIKDQGRVMELPAEMFLTVAILLVHGYMTSSIAPLEESPADLVREVYHALIKRKISLATPLLRNLRRPKGSLTSCFVLQMDDSRDSIFYIVDQVSRISKNGGGVGIDITPIRAKGSPVQGHPNTSGGVVPWLRIINDTAVAVNQTGARAGAVTCALRIWHKDIEEFLEMQTENGDQRRKAFDIYPQVVIPDLFMQRVASNDSWLLVCPFECKTKLDVDLLDTWGHEFEQRYQAVERAYAQGQITGHKIRARDMMKKIVEVQVETGLPYIFFIDTVNRMNPNQNDGMIPCGNLCQESYSNVKRSTPRDPVFKEGHIVQEIDAGLMHCCNLLSLNLATIQEDEIAPLSRLAVKILDASVAMTATPTVEAHLHNEHYRTIGVGAMGLADWLAYRKIRYDSEEGRKAAAHVMEQIAYHAYDASSDLALTHGAFKAFPLSMQAKGVLFGKNAAELCKQGHLDWKPLVAKIQDQGLRHSQVLAVAPTTSTSLIQGATASVLPPYGKFFFDKNGGQTVPICPPFLGERFWHYKEFKHMDQKDVVAMCAGLQKWIDTGISMELVFDLNNEDMSLKSIYDTIAFAWEKQVKCIYYIRSVQKGLSGVKASVEEVCASCSG